MKKKALAKPKTARGKAAPVEHTFAEVVHLIEAARQCAYQAVNTALIDLYWQVGEFISTRIASDGWGKGTIASLATFIQRRQPGIRGFSPQNLWRMRQFFDAYQEQSILSPLLRELPWSSNLHILGKAKTPEEREFYLRMATRNRWPVREVARQIDSSLFERTVLRPVKLSTALRETHPRAANFLKDSYIFEFLELPADHSESDLHSSLLRNLGCLLTELGRDFCFIGSEYPVQVGGRDFALDLLFFHRGLNCLVAVELKAGRFEPEHLGKLEFYLEALDRDVKKPHERPSIGLLLCATKDTEVVEYALSRALSPTMIAEYETMLPDKKLLMAKLHEFYQLLAPSEPGRKGGSEVEGGYSRPCEKSVTPWGQLILKADLEGPRSRAARRPRRNGGKALKGTKRRDCDPREIHPKGESSLFRKELSFSLKTEIRMATKRHKRRKILGLEDLHRHRRITHRVRSVTLANPSFLGLLCLFVAIHVRI